MYVLISVLHSSTANAHELANSCLDLTNEHIILLQLGSAQKEDLEKDLSKVETRIKVLAYLGIASAVETLARHLSFVILVR